MKKLFSFILLATVVFFLKPTSTKASGCDTLFNLISNLDTITYYYVDTTAGAGYISGNNKYGDLAKAERFAGPAGSYVNSAVLYFALATINSTDTALPITIGIWDNTGMSIDSPSGSAPGNMIDSIHVSLGEIAGTIEASQLTHSLVGLLVNFNGGVALTTDTFYVGVILPTIQGDTLALFTNEVPPGPDGNGWELSDANYGGGWGSYNADWGFTGGSLGNYIIANICTTPNTTILQTSFTASDTMGCVPDTVNFTDMTVPYASYWNWSFGDGGSSSAISPSHVYSSPGVYTVSEVSFNLVPAFLGAVLEFYYPAFINITVNASPGATNSITPATSNSSATGSAVVTPEGGTGPYTYAWSNNGGTADSISNVIAGNYTVTITDSLGCKYVDMVDINVTGIMQLSANQQVKIYPNPATDLLNLVWSQQSNANVSIIDMNGNIVSTYESVGATNNIYDVHNLPSGTYVIRIADRTSNAQHSMLFTKL